MKKATRISYKKNDYGFDVEYGYSFCIRAIQGRNKSCFLFHSIDDKGVAVISSYYAGQWLEDFASILLGCFNPKSNFNKKIKKRFDFFKEREVKKFKVRFNGKEFEVTPEMSVDDIVKAYQSI